MRQRNKLKLSPTDGRGQQLLKVGPWIYRIQVIDRAAEILDCFTFEQPELPVSAIAAKTGIHKSTAHRILMALEYNSMIGQNPVTGNYYLGMKLFKLGNQAAARMNLREMAKPYLVQLMEETKETVHLAVLDENEVLYLEKVEGPHALRMPSRVGRRIPIYCTSLGKAMLSCLEKQQVKQLLHGRRLKAYTPNTATDIDELLEDLEKTRRRGYAIDNEEIELGLRCVGAPIRDYSGHMVGAVSVAGPSSRLNTEKLQLFGVTVLKVAASVSRELGYETVRGYANISNK
ncbi:MAG TPA: IclR family transcriptional regulator [Candidatus Binatia bacterium]|nr:IclR family transcriptional regulator [Candidatus Binatia bacterium]